MPGIGYISDIDVDKRKAVIQEQITLWVGNQRLEEVLKVEELAQLAGIDKALLLRNGLLIGAVRHCRLNCNADSRMPVLTFITFCADNAEGTCYLSVTRMCKIFRRSRETITKAINSLEAQGQIGVK